jgi:lysine 2,3-aminomutase
VILLVAHTCTMYCRFCFRRPVPTGNALPGLKDRLRTAFDYLAEDPRIQEVILSGGDPLTLDDESLAGLLERLHAISHLRVLRIHSRTPVTLPSRVTPELVEVLRSFRPLYLVVHFNHPRELTQEASKGLQMLLDAGIPLLNQSVLLKGVNDSVDVLAELCWGLLERGVTPYYLHHCDRTPGTGMFRTSIRRGRALHLALKGRIPGHGLPRYIIDLPGGYGKVSLEAPFAVELDDSRWQLTSERGETFDYQDEPEEDTQSFSPALST